jgi:hypothetical protein
MGRRPGQRDRIWCRHTQIDVQMSGDRNTKRKSMELESVGREGGLLRVVVEWTGCFDSPPIFVEDVNGIVADIESDLSSRCFLNGRGLIVKMM